VVSATVFVWGFAIGLFVARLIDAVKAIRAAKRAAARRIADARARVRAQS
jgi:hypothetical protein